MTRAAPDDPPSYHVTVAPGPGQGCVTATSFRHTAPALSSGTLNCRTCSPRAILVRWTEASARVLRILLESSVSDPKRTTRLGMASGVGVNALTMIATVDRCM